MLDYLGKCNLILRVLYSRKLFLAEDMGGGNNSQRDAMVLASKIV